MNFNQIKILGSVSWWVYEKLNPLADAFQIGSLLGTGIYKLLTWLT